MAKKIGVIEFPGSNCDHDAYYAMKNIMGYETRFLWHKETNLDEIDFLIIPGGFSYGDYLRSGAIARFSPIMNSVVNFAKKGFPVLGICNGFQVLLEANLLPGAMLHNQNLRFICKNVHIRVENNQPPFTSGFHVGEIFQIPVSHGEGNYFIDSEGLEELKSNQQIAFRYCESDGQFTDRANVNGSVYSIAGITNKKGNVLGMMPHPERAMESILGNTDGYRFFETIFNQLQPV